MGSSAGLHKASYLKKRGKFLKPFSALRRIFSRVILENAAKLRFTEYNWNARSTERL